MDQQKKLLSSLLANSLDRASLLYNLTSLKVQYDDEEPSVILKYKLQLRVVENIFKGINRTEENVYYETLMKESKDYLRFHLKKNQVTTYQCSLVGCLFKCRWHRNYIRHIQRAHSKETRIVCQFGLKCTRTFASIDLLLQHVEHVHKDIGAGVQVCSTVVPVDQPCKCKFKKCLGMEFPSIQKLMLHLRNNHVGQGIECIFDKCDKKFTNSNALRNHFYLKHQKLNLYSLKEVHKLFIDNIHSDCSDKGVDHLNDIDSEETLPDHDHQSSNVSDVDEYDDNCGKEVEDDAEDAAEEDPDLILMAYCDFLNRLSNFQFVPQTTIKVIAEEYMKNYNKSNEVKYAFLKESLKKIPGISESEIQRVLEDSQKNDPFLDAQRQLDTEYKRTRFITEKFSYVAPLEIVLNPHQVKNKEAVKAVVHYIPIIDTFKNLIQDPSFNDMMEKDNHDKDDGAVRDVKDGDLFKSNPYFKQNPEAFTMMLYSDAIELTNPLGAGRGKHKIIQVFYTLCEVAKSQRSKIDRIMLVAVFKEKLVKQYGLEMIYKQLVEDLKILEAGVDVQYPIQRTVKCGLLIHPADNLEAHAVGGFSQSFSSYDICRFCHCQYDDIKENIHDYGSYVHDKWTTEEYDAAATVVENRRKAEAVNESEERSSEDEDGDREDSNDAGDEVELFGIKHRCPLNVLRAFHSVTGFPPDLLHDLYEGVISQDLLGIIRILSRKKWFSIADYNKMLQSLNYKGSEASDRPQSVPLKNSTKKLIGKACSIWVHMRNFPFIIRKFVKNEEDPVLRLGLMLHEITERLTAAELREYEIVVLEELIISYLDERKEISESYGDLLGPPKPKTHFLTHYPQAIRLYGPPMSYWTARYESRHRLAKNTAEASKNFINISLTVATRQQLRQSSVLYHGMFSTSDLVISAKVIYKSSLGSKTMFDKAIYPYMSETDFLCSEMEIKNQVYKKGQLVILKMLNPDEMKVGLILSILVQNNAAYFVTNEYVAHKQSLQYFKAQSEDPPIVINDVSTIVDYKPLVNHGTSSQLFFCLHHHVSFCYP